MNRVLQEASGLFVSISIINQRNMVIEMFVTIISVSDIYDTFS